MSELILPSAWYDPEIKSWRFYMPNGEMIQPLSVGVSFGEVRSIEGIAQVNIQLIVKVVYDKPTNL